MHTSTNSALRILMVLENCSYPQDIRVSSEAETLVQAGHQVSVICPHLRGQPWRETLHGVRLFRFPTIEAHQGLWGYLAEFGYATAIMFIMVLWRWLRDGFDVLHFHNPPDMLFVTGLLPKLAGKRLIFDHHDLSVELYCAKHAEPKAWICRFLHFLEKSSCRVVDRVITVNESYRAYDIEQHGIAADSIWVVRNGPNLCEFPDPIVVPTNSHSGSTLIGYIGYIAAQDGFDHLLNALYHLQRDLGRNDWRCLVIGQAEDPTTIENLVTELELTGQIDFVGRKPHGEALEMLATIDIGVAPEPANTFNERSTMIKVMEYMALGKPVVAYDLVEHRVSAGEAALYSKPSDPRDMALKLAQLIDQPELRQQLGAIGRQRIEHHLSWEHSGRVLIECYRSLSNNISAQNGN